MTDWLDKLIEYRNNNIPCVLVSVVETSGSVPRGAGAKMVVSPAATSGTVGGGALELQVIELARELLAQKKPKAGVHVLNSGAAAEEQDNRCVAAVRLFFEPLFVDGFEIYLFGAGHVGRALAHVLAPLSCRLHWIDSRADLFPSKLPGNVFVHSGDEPGQAVLAAPENSYFLVMTHRHALDFEICEAILRRNDFAYCGMIGSASKLQQFERYLNKRGQPAELLARLTCPMGIARIKSREPPAIAIAIAAELLQTREWFDAA